MPAHNERFHESGGVCPPELLCGFATAPPAQAFVSPRPREAAATLCASGRHVPSLNTLTLFSTTLLNNGVREKSALPKKERQKLQF